MYQVLKMSGQLYAADVSKLDDEELVERIKTFTNEGTPSIMVQDLDDLEEIGIDVGDVQIVEIDG